MRLKTLNVSGSSRYYIFSKGVKKLFINYQRRELRIEATSSADAYGLREIVSSVS